MTYWAEILHMTSFNVLKIKFECHNSVSVWLFVRPSIFCTFLLHASTHLTENLFWRSLGFFNAFLLEKYYINIAFYTPVFRRDVLWYGDVRPGLRPTLRPVSVRPSVHPSVRVSVRPFSALFSYMLWHIELKLCTWLCFNVLQSKFECRHFASIFEGVMPLCELRI